MAEKNKINWFEKLVIYVVILILICIVDNYIGYSYALYEPIIPKMIFRAIIGVCIWFGLSSIIIKLINSNLK